MRRPPRCPSTAPTSRSAALETLQHLQALTHRSVELFHEKKYDEVEKVLNDALALAPGDPTTLYNLACVKAVTGKSDDALTFLEQAANAGFADFIHIQEDTDLTSLRNLPRFKALMGRKDAIQRQAAQHALDSLKREFGDKYLYDIDEKSRLIFATNTDAATLAALKKDLIAQANSQWAQLFEHKPEQYISIILPSATDYAKLVQTPGVGGFYNHAFRMLIAQRLGQVMTHEFTHALNAADLDPTGQQHPIWLVEGLAVMFEAGTYEGEVLTPHDNFRLPYLQFMAKHDKLIPLEKLLKMPQKEFVSQSQATLAYGQSGSVLLYLYEQKLLKKFYDTVKATWDKDNSAKLALEQVSGKKLADFESAWRAWMLKRSAPAMSTGKDGAFLGVRFGQANDGLRVDDVVDGSPAARAGVHSGDIVVGLGEQEVRDWQSFMPMLKEHKPGETVKLRVRRHETYLDLDMTLGRRNGEKG